jgi:hypothetical protein
MTPADPQEKSMSAPTAATVVLPEKAPTDTPSQKTETTSEEPTAGPTARRVGRWVHAHHKFFNGNLGWFTVKQVTASFIASFNMMCTAIPTAFALDWLHSSAAKRLTQMQNSGIEPGFFTKHWGNPEIHKPLRAMAFVATGFTMYRGTRKIFNKVYEKLFNPQNSEEKTIQEVAHLPQSIGAAIKDVMPAEAQSTPFGAVALGGIRSLYSPPKATDAAYIAGKPGATWGKALVHPKSKFAEQAIIDTLGYAAFFELSDRLYKDVQLRKEKWNGKPHSIATIKHSAMDDKAPAGDDDPSLKRLVFRRIIPTAMGITAYAITHRASKMLTGAPTAPTVDDGRAQLFKKFFHSFGAEWAAIGTFFIHSAIAEKYEKAYDALFERLTDKERAAQQSRN